MKRCCKRINITDRNLIERAAKECLDGKMNRSDVIRMFSEYSGVSYNAIKKICKDKRMMNGVIQTVVDGIQQEIINKKYIVKPIRYRKQVDKCNGKIRNIGIQDIKQQIYDYIAVVPHAGTWIEIPFYGDYDVKPTSFPTRERG